MREPRGGRFAFGFADLLVDAIQTGASSVHTTPGAGTPERLMAFPKGRKQRGPLCLLLRLLVAEFPG